MCGVLATPRKSLRIDYVRMRSCTLLFVMLLGSGCSSIPVCSEIQIDNNEPCHMEESGGAYHIILFQMKSIIRYQQHRQQHLSA